LCISNRNLLYPDAVLARACRKPSDALALSSNRLDPIRELLQEFAGAVADELAMFIEELVGIFNRGDRASGDRMFLPMQSLGIELSS
jgi:hypothetical protein